MENTIDIPMSLSDLEVVNSCYFLTYVLLEGAQFLKDVQVDSLIRMVIYEDEDLIKVMTGKGKVESRGTEFFDVRYIRHCRAKDVNELEWDAAQGFYSLEHFLHYTKGSPDDIVKVVCLNKLHYSLRALNLEYGRNTIGKRERRRRLS